MATPGEFEGIVDSFAQSIYAHAYRMLGNREDAEEATQDVFLRIHRSLGGFRGTSKISTWIWRITINVCLSRRSAKRNGPAFTGREEAFAETPDGDPGPEGAFIENENRTLLGKSISLLPEKEAAAITLFYMEGMSYSEIADILHLPSGSVATALHRGRERLARMLRGSATKVHQ